MQGSSSSKSRVQAFNTPRSLQGSLSWNISRLPMTSTLTLPQLSPRLLLYPLCPMHSLQCRTIDLLVSCFTVACISRKHAELLSTESLVKQASAYLTSPTSGKVSSRSQEEAYVLLLKAATLAIVQLPKHPAFTSKLNAERRKMLANQSQNILAQLSELKPVIQKRRAQWETNNPPETVEPPSPPEVVFPDTDEPCSGPTSLKRRIAVRHQFDAASAAQQPTSSASNRQSSASSQRTAPSQPSNTEKRTSSLQEDPSVPAMDHLVDVPAWKPPEPTAPPSHKFDSAHQDQQGFIPSRAQASIVYPYLPSRPKDPRASRPSKEVYSATSVPKNAEVSIPKLSGLRRLTLPSTLIDSFVALAWHNTEQKIETCGLLLGQLNAASDELQVKTLLIPKQKGRSDSCEMIDEEEIFEAQEARQLLT